MYNNMNRFNYKSSGLFLIFALIYQSGYGCSVCRGNLTDNEIVAYTFSIILLISIMSIFIIIIYKKIKNNYGIN